MRFPFDGRYAPLMERVSFIKAPIHIAMQAFLEWYTSDRKPLTTHAFQGNFEDLLLRVLPFNEPYQLVFVPTTNGWTAAFTNSELAEGPNFGIVSKFLNCEVVWIQAILKDYDIQVNGWGGGTIEFIDKGECKRIVSLLYDERWDFSTWGDPLPFETPAYYTARYARNRFTPQILQEYAQAVGIDFFNEHYYLPQGTTAYVLEHHYTTKRNPISLEEARKARGLDA